MARAALRGITWDHRRAIDPLLQTMAAFRARHPDIDIQWSSRPLSGFEFAPVDDLAKAFDLIVLDHPFMGAVARSRSLMPADDIVDGVDPFVGPSLASYRYGGALWAVPIDAACQVAAARPDLLAKLDAAAPRDWAGLMDLGARARRRGLWLAIGLKGVHGLMTFFTLMANLGTPCATERAHPFADRAAGRAALALMGDLLALCPPQALDWNSIALHDAMVARDDLVFCPAVYCYATYAETDQRRPLRFHDFPGPRGPGGSTIGGAGLAVSSHCKTPAEAFAYLRFAATAATQLHFAQHHGQPAHRAAWDDAATNRRFGDCYRNTRATIEGCWTRPRYDGYLSFQETGGALVEAHLRGEIAADPLLDRLQRLHAAA